MPLFSQPSRLSQFDFSLPRELIALYPLSKRSASRLLCLNKAPCDDVLGANPEQVMPFTHCSFVDFPSLLTSNDLLVLNNTKVIPARLHARKITSGGLVDILVERPLDENKAYVQLKASRTPALGSVLQLLTGPCATGQVSRFMATVCQRENEKFILAFDQPLKQVLDTIGHMPLPPYIKRDTIDADKSRYQTVYAETEGAIAAPTAGLHFDSEVFDALTQRGVDMAYVTLHVGLGTFLPIRSEVIAQHTMHKEYVHLAADTCDKILATKRRGGRVIAVGTTTVRTLEAAAQASASGQSELHPFEGQTDLFITPGYPFKVVDAMLTNFHLPKSTLIILVCAFAGYKNTLSAYQEAVAKQYRFFSYGDAMFIS